VLEKLLAEKAGLGWINKNSMLMNKTQGSFFIGFIYSNLDHLSELPDEPKKMLVVNAKLV
jgi:epoxyqueuosine reductase QueG